MCRKLVTAAAAFFLGFAGPALADEIDPSLVGWWKFDGDALDSSGNDRHGTLGGDPQFVAGVYGQALEFDGDDSVTITGYKGITGTAPFSVAAWIKTDSTVTKTIVTWGTTSSGAKIELRIINSVLRVSHGAGNVNSATVVADGQWHHVALTVQANSTVSYPQMILYVDGHDDAVPSTDADPPLDIIPSFDVGIGWRSTNSDRYWEGLIDEVYLYDKVLSAAEVAALAMRPKAYEPTPADGALGVTDPLLSWQPRTTAVSRNVYLGMSPDLGEADLVSRNLPTTLYWHAPGFEPGTTYYWRVDEVDPDGTVYSGDVWTFMFSPIEAWDPHPMDGAPYMDPSLTLTWRKGLSGISYDVYFGADESAVAEGTGDAFKGNQFVTSFATGELAMNTTYYWRVDEVDAAGNKTTGSVWSFTTLPQIPITDPNLVAWWKFNAGIGARAVDWSGHGNHGAIFGADWLVPGWIGDAVLNTAGKGYVAIENFSYDDANGTEATVCAWIRTARDADQAIMSFDRNEYWRLEINGNGGGPGQVGWDVMTSTGQIDLGSLTRVDDGQWHHVAGVFEGGTLRIYIDGRLDAWAAGGSTFGSGNTRYGFIGSRSEAASFNAGRGGNPTLFDGALDDVRLYDKALSQEAILEVMRGDPLLAWDLQPTNGKIVDIRDLAALSWRAGDMAAEHDVYLGPDPSAVEAADASDGTGVYRERRSATTYAPPGGFVWGQTYFWRIDEVNTDGTVAKGGVRTFTVADYLIVDSFESYTDDYEAGEAIWQTWIDGLTNNTGSTVGNWEAPFAERTIVYSGAQAMPIDYNNIPSPWYSEAERTWDTPQDWTFADVNTLVVFFRGQVPSFIETAPDAITLGAAGTDIWDISDEFRYAFKRLNGDGSIIARIESLTDTHAAAKAGLMIRETLDPGARFAMVYMTGNNGLRFGIRPANNDVVTSDGSVATPEQSALREPVWMKLERVGNEFSAYYSDDGVNWTALVWNPQTVVMGSSLYVGLAVTSHAAGTPTTAEFSGIQTTGNVTGPWQVADVGVAHPGNTPDSVYVAVEDKANKVAVIAHPDPQATILTDWQAWTIDLGALPGVNVSAVKKMYIGVGDRDNPQPGGAGRIYIDDIRLTKGVPIEPNAPATP